MPQIIEMRSLIRPQLFTFDRSVDGPFCLYATIDRDRPNTVFPLIDRRQAHAEEISSRIPTAENFDEANESFIRDRIIHARKSKALLWKYQVLLQNKCEKQTSPMESALDLAKRLKIGQVEAHITDADIAAACEVSAQAVGQWKKTGRVHKRHLATIAALYGKSVNWLLGNTEVENDARERELLAEFRALSREFQLIAIKQIRSLREPEIPQTLHEPQAPYKAKRTTAKKLALDGHGGKSAKFV